MSDAMTPPLPRNSGRSQCGPPGEAAPHLAQRSAGKPPRAIRLAQFQHELSLVGMVSRVDFSGVELDRLDGGDGSVGAGLSTQRCVLLEIAGGAAQRQAATDAVERSGRRRKAQQGRRAEAEFAGFAGGAEWIRTFSSALDRRRFRGSSRLGPIYRRTGHPRSCRPRQTDRVVERRPEEPPLTARVRRRHTMAALSAVRGRDPDGGTAQRIAARPG